MTHISSVLPSVLARYGITYQEVLDHMNATELRHAVYVITAAGGHCLTIRDIGNHKFSKTITNDAEWVVADLYQRGLLRHGQTLLYYDSLNELSEIVHVEGKLMGFAPGPKGAA